MSRIKESDMKEKDIQKFEKVQAQLESLHNEISALSKKSQNESLNTFKLKFVNNTILEANELLGSDYKPYTDFDKFDQDDLPTNSDVAMILGQYINCMEKLRSDNVEDQYGAWYWTIDNKISEIQTSRPKKLIK
jgi:hypothetical protein